MDVLATRAETSRIFVLSRASFTWRNISAECDAPRIDQTSISRSLLMLRPDRGRPQRQKSGPRQDIAGSLQGRNACAQESNPPSPQRWDLKTQPPETTFQSKAFMNVLRHFERILNHPTINHSFQRALLSFVVSDSALPLPYIAP